MKNNISKTDIALLVFFPILLLSVKAALGQSGVPIKNTKLIPTSQQFKNGDLVYSVEYRGTPVGEFWPVHEINLVTRQTDSLHFTTTTSIADIQSALRGMATAPDGMTAGSTGMYTMEGKALSHGRPCGDGVVRDYGIVVVDKGFSITFTHAREHNVDSLYDAVRARKGTLFYLPSMYRNGKALNSSAQVDKVLIRRTVPKTATNPNGEQIGVIVFNGMVSYTDAVKIVTGLDRTNQQGGVVSQTTHIYVLDGGPTWGQSCKEVNGQAHLVGTRNATVVTNYLVFY